MGCRRHVDGVCGCRSWARRGRSAGEGTGWGREVTGTQQDGLLVPSSVLLQGGASQARDSPAAVSFQAASAHPRVLDCARHPGAHDGLHHQQLRVPHPALAVSLLASPHTPPSCWGSPQPGWGGSGIPARDARSVCVTDGCVVPTPVRSDACPACVPWLCGESGAGGGSPGVASRAERCVLVLSLETRLLAGRVFPAPRRQPSGACTDAPTEDGAESRVSCRSTVHPASPPLLCTREDEAAAESPLRILAESPDSFEKHIRSILQRSVANPAFLKYAVRDVGAPQGSRPIFLLPIGPPSHMSLACCQPV